MLASLSRPMLGGLSALVFLLGPQETESRPALPELEQQAKATPALQQLIPRVAKAMRTEQAPARIDGFSASLSFTLNLEDGGQAVLKPKIWYRRRPLGLRVAVQVNGNDIQYVRSGRQLWMRNQGKVIDMSGKKEYQRDRDQANLYLSIARLVPKLVFPDVTLKNAVEPKGPTEESWQAGSRRQAIPMYRVEFRTAPFESYPLISKPDYDGPQILTMRIRRDTLLPFAYEYQAYDADKGEPVGLVEDLIFLERSRFDGMQLPVHWKKRMQDPKTKKMRVAQTWKLLEFTPNPEFQAAVFRKP